MPSPSLEHSLQDAAPLREAWYRLLGEEAMVWWTKAQNAYSEPHRAYHTLAHLVTMYDLYQAHGEALGLTSWELVFVLAIVFHDFVYNPLSKTNELDSITLFREFVNDVRPPLDVADIVLVETMIDATILHQVPASCTSDETRYAVGCFLDLDLAILSRPNDLYEGYTEQIRLEYIAYGDAEFRKGRAAVLRSFLCRDQLYFTRQIQAEWTAAARANIERELMDLTD